MLMSSFLFFSLDFKSEQIASAGYRIKFSSNFFYIQMSSYYILSNVIMKFSLQHGSKTMNH